MKNILLAGAGGHAKVLIDIIHEMPEFSLAGAVDPQPRGRGARLSGLKILGGDKDLKRLKRAGIRYAGVGLGSIGDTAARRRVFERLESLGFELPFLAHGTAIISDSVRLGAGAQVMAGVILNAGVRVSKNAVINTGAIIEHDVTVGPHAFIGPGARVGGEVSIGSGAFIGIGATLKQGVRIGARAVIGAGAVVLTDVPAGKTAFGVPARTVKG